MIGEQLGGYRIESVIGRGGMGIVYLAEQIRLERKVALKVITPELAHDVGFRTRFERESRLAASIDHPNVVPVYEAGEADGLLYIAMRYVPGTDLKSVLAREGALEPRRAAAIVTGVAGALDAAHASGLVHRDVKPGNTLLEPAQGGERVYLTDFGLTKRLSSASGITETGFVVGTLDYIAPEQVSGAPVDARTDVYALACVLFHALSGHVPYERNDDMAKMYAHANLPVPSLLEASPNVPPALQDVIERGMAKEPEARYASAGDLGRAAQAALEGHTPTLAERSVAIGAAAPGHATVADTPPPAAAPTAAAPPPGPPTAPTQPLPPEPAAYPPRRPPPQMPMGSPPPSPQRSSAPIVAAVMALALLIGGAVALLATGTLGGGDDEPTTTTEIRTTPRTDRGDDTTTDGTQPRPRPATTSFEPYSSDLGSFTTVLPTGDGWSGPSESQVSDGLFRVRQTGPDGLEVIIDHTPGEAATFKPANRCVETGVPNFQYASRCQFQGGTLAPCQRATCVDYLLNSGVDGPGWGVLVGGGGTLTETQDIARKIAFEMEPTN